MVKGLLFVFLVNFEILYQKVVYFSFNHHDRPKDQLALLPSAQMQSKDQSLLELEVRPEL